MGIEIEPPVKLRFQVREKGPLRMWIEDLRRRYGRRSAHFSLQAALPPGVTREEAIEVVASSEWAQNLAAGWLRRFFPEMRPGTPEYEKKKWEIARAVAAGIV